MPWLLPLTAAVTGLLAGASLDQSIKQLPARHVIGDRAFAKYSQAADLRQGVVFYGILGGAVLLLNLAAAIAVSRGYVVAPGLPIYLGALLAILHSIATAVAAPTNFSQRRARDNAALRRVFERFERLQALRCALQLANFGATLWALG
jgi:hypothetical protein